MLSCTAFAQQPDTLWTGLYPAWEGFDDCQRLIQTSDGGFAIGGKCGYPFWDYLFIKVNVRGEMEWARNYGAQRNHDFFGGFVQMPDDGYVLVGTINRDAVNTTSLLKIDADGDSVWARGYGTTEFYDVTLSHDGCAVAAGLTNEHAEFGSWDAWLVKVDDDGEVIWRGIYGGRGGDSFIRVIPTNDKGFLGVGNTSSFGGVKGFIVKTDSLGNQEWMRAVSASNEIHAFVCAIEAPDGSYLAGGNGRQNDDQEFYLVKFTANGDTVWSRKWGAEEVGSDRINDLVNAPGGGYLVVGEDQKSRYPIIRLNEEGEVTWRFDFGNEVHSRIFNAVLATEDGGYLIGGKNTSRLSEDEAYLVRTAPDPAYNSVSLLDPAFPSLLALSTPYPNPFNSSTTISFSILPVNQKATRLSIYGLDGRLVIELVNERLLPGEYSVGWNATGLPTGAYLCRLEAGGISRSMKLLLIR